MVIMARKNPNDPEPGHNLRLRIIEFLKMMMQWRHEKNPPAFAEPHPRIFKPAYLDNNGKAFCNKDAAKDGDQQFFADQYGKTAMIPPMARLPVSPIKTWAG